MQNAEKNSKTPGNDGSPYEAFNSKTYTFDPEIQKCFLALWVQDPNYLKQNRRFCKSVFFAQDDMYRVADQVLRHYDREFAPPDELMLVNRLRHYAKGGKQKFDLEATVALAREIFNMPIEARKGTLMDWMVGFGRVEQTKTAFRRGVEFLKEGKYDDIEKVMTQLFDFYRDNSFEGADGAFLEDSLAATIANRRNRALQRVPTGVVALDKYLGGGLGRGQLYVMVGGTGVGKTTGALRFLRGAISAGIPAIMISTELQRERIEDKFHAAVSGVPMGMPMIEHEDVVLEKMRKFLEKRKKKGHLVWFEPFTATVHMIRKYVEDLALWHNFFPQLVVIDSPDLLKAAEKHQKPHEALAEIYTTLFAWAGRENVAMLVTTDVKQASRDNALVGVTDIGGSYEKPKKADGVFGLGRDKERHKVDENGCFKILFNVDKLRTDGTSGAVYEVEVAPHLGRWTGIETLTHEQIKAITAGRPKAEPGAAPTQRKGKTPDERR